MPRLPKRRRALSNVEGAAALWHQVLGIPSFGGGTLLEHACDHLGSRGANRRKSCPKVCGPTCRASRSTAVEQRQVFVPEDCGSCTRLSAAAAALRRSPPRQVLCRHERHRDACDGVAADGRALIVRVRGDGLAALEQVDARTSRRRPSRRRPPRPAVAPQLLRPRRSTRSAGSRSTRRAACAPAGSSSASASRARCARRSRSSV